MWKRRSSWKWRWRLKIENETVEFNCGFDVRGISGAEEMLLHVAIR